MSVGTLFCVGVDGERVDIERPRFPKEGEKLGFEIRFLVLPAISNYSNKLVNSEDLLYNSKMVG